MRATHANNKIYELMSFFALINIKDMIFQYSPSYTRCNSAIAILGEGELV